LRYGDLTASGIAGGRAGLNVESADIAGVLATLGVKRFWVDVVDSKNLTKKDTSG